MYVLFSFFFNFLLVVVVVFVFETRSPYTALVVLERKLALSSDTLLPQSSKYGAPPCLPIEILQQEKSQELDELDWYAWCEIQINKKFKKKRKERKKFPELNTKSDILINLVTFQFLAYYITAVLLVCYDIFFRDHML